ncbi:hypothetical protein ACQ86G_18890 [Roseateles chitinivorans]|uniref:hypothetical protein n=1 Tax=Roseateles chitinivorans TaxID=2917965 RepID=UPI003D67CBD1
MQELLNQRVAGQPFANAQTVLDYDARGLLRTTTDALSYTTSTDYNAFGQAATTTRQIGLGAGGAVVSQALIYDRRGLLKERTDDAGGLKALTKTDYDAFGRLVKTTDARTVASTTGYDRIGRIVQTVDGGNTRRVTNYDAFSRIISTIDGNSQTTSYRYDLAARTVVVTTPEAVSTRVTRNRHGEVESSTDGNSVTTSYVYTENGELKSTTTPLNATSTVYDRLGRVERTVDANQVATRFEYDALNRVTKRIADPDGAGALQLTTVYDYQDTDSGTSVLTTEPDGRKTLQNFDREGRLTRRVVDPDALKLTTSYEMDGADRVLTVTDPNNIVTRYEYDALGRRTAEITDARSGGLNLTKRYVYDAAGNLIASRDWSNAPTLYVRDGAGRPVYEIDPLGAARITEYDGEGRVRRVTALATAIAADVRQAWGDAPTLAQVATAVAAARVPAKDQVSGVVYDRDGRVKFTVDAAGGVVEVRLDGAGRVRQQIAYETAVDPATWLDTATSATTVGAGGKDRVTSTQYDKLGRVTMVVDAEGGVTTMAYDAAGQLRQKTAFARVTANLATLRTKGAAWVEADVGLVSVPAQDRTTNYRYDKAGRLRFEYDAGGYVTETRYAGLTTTSIRYAATTAVDATPTANAALDHASSVTLDAAGRVWKSVDAMTVETRNAYDKGGRLTAQTQAYGLVEATTTGYVYDEAGHVIRKTVAQGTAAEGSTRYGYDALGRMTTEIEARGVALAESTSLWAQAERQRLGKPADVLQLQPADKTALLAKYTTTYEYDAAGRRTKTINALSAATSTQYDAFGNAVKVTDPLGNVGYFYFDKLNRVTMQVDPEGYATRMVYEVAGSNQVTKVRRYSAKVLGVTTAKMPEPATNATKDALTTNVYDRLDRLVSSSVAVGLSSVTESTLYNVAGNRFDKQVTNKVGGTAVFNTDRLGNTVLETLPVTMENKPVVNRYEYDAFGNRTISVEAVKPAGASSLWRERTTEYRYDKAGRLTHRIGMAYDAYDGVTQTSSRVVPVEWTRYDALGRVLEQVSRGTWANASQVVGGARSLNRYDAAGNKTEQVAADGAYTAFAYDAAGHVVRENAMGTAATVTGSTWVAPSANVALDRNTVKVYDALGRLTEVKRENVRYWEADPASNQILAPLSSLTTVRLQALVYDAAGNVVQEIDARNQSVYSYYDKLGRKSLRIDQAGYAVAWDYEGFQDVATTEQKYARALGAGTFKRQDDTGQPTTQRDPSMLRIGLAGAGDRTTKFQLDTLGRVTEKRVLGVATTYVNGEDKTVDTQRDAVSTFEYDGLGNVTRQRDLVGLTPDGTAEVWNQTDIRYDGLGREVHRVSPGFTNFEGNWALPVLDTEYNGLGLVSRTIQRGMTAAEDRVSVYDYNDNGDRTQVVDANFNYTQFDLDAMGQVSRETAKLAMAVKQGSATVRVDRVKRYAHDVMGRVTAEYDGDGAHTATQTGEVRRTRYNVFGEITGKGVGDGWQEFAEYNVLGKVERSNSESGVIAVTLYDRNGNATRKIVSGVADWDLRGMSIGDAAADLVHLNHTFSVYDSRNQLVKTVDFAASYQTDVAARESAVTQKLTDLYGSISTTPAGGGAYTGAAGTSPGGIKDTTVTGSDGAGALTNGAVINGTEKATEAIVDGEARGPYVIQGGEACMACSWLGQTM